MISKTREKILEVKVNRNVLSRYIGNYVSIYSIKFISRKCLEIISRWLFLLPMLDYCWNVS
jgi:hypothetical protein